MLLISVCEISGNVHSLTWNLGTWWDYLGLSYAGPGVELDDPCGSLPLQNIL